MRVFLGPITATYRATGGFPAFAYLLSGLPPTWFPCSSLEFQPSHVANRTSARRYPVVRIEFAIPRRDATFPAVLPSVPPRRADVTRARNSRRGRVLQLDFAGNRVGIIFPYQVGRAPPPPQRRPCRRVVLSAKYRHVTRARRARNEKLRRRDRPWWIRIFWRRGHFKSRRFLPRFLIFYDDTFIYRGNTSL